MTDSLGLNAADIIAFIAILIGIGVGFRQGLTAQMAIFLMALSVWAALVNGFVPCRDWFAAQFSMPLDLARIAALISLIVIPLLIIALLYSVLRYVMKLTFTTWIDRVGGAVAGGITAAGIALLIFILLNTLPPEKRPDITGEKSWIYRQVAGVETQLIDRIITRVNKGENSLLKAREARAGKREKWEQ
jgi:uncharacterized membrane protein required for colicin V production